MIASNTPKVEINDPLIHSGEIEFHEKLHSHRAGQDLETDPLSNPRLDVFPAIEKLIDFEISGCVADIGCGNGYFSIWATEHRLVSRCVAMEITRSAVEHLIPQTIARCHGDPSRIEPTLGSFNQLPEERFDYIVALGALHHSSDLPATLNSVVRALKPGGRLIAQEPMSDDMTSNADLVTFYAKQEHFEGVGDISKADRSDNMYRRCEYLTALHHSGLDIELLERRDIVAPPKPKKLKKRIRAALRSQKEPEPERIITVVPMVIVARRPKAPIATPHLAAPHGN